ncbi:MAG: hypothetical protein M3O64_03155 [Chloroflexota bacterium]|nr:hypothetical protein [Chloroflexota bacterium]
MLFTAGERKLPGGRAALVLSIGLLVSCAAPAATPSPPATVPAAVATPTDAPAAIPTLGTKPPPGLALQSYFATITASDNGALALLTTPASRCGLLVRRPSGAIIDAGERVADAKGIASWSYQPLGDHGESILTATCALGDQTETAKAQVLLP